MIDEAVINDLPIPQVWEWVALRELTSIMHGLVSEGFDSPGDLIDRLDSVSEAIAQLEAYQKTGVAGDGVIAAEPQRRQLNLLEEQDSEE